MMHPIDKPRTPRHILWHWILGAVMIIDGLVSVLSLGLLTSWFTTSWIESAMGDRLHSHATLPSKDPGPTEDEFIDEIRARVAQQMGIDPRQLEVVKGGQMPMQTPNPKEWN